MTTIYGVYYQAPDYSHPDEAKIAFSTRADAEEYISQQPGRGGLLGKQTDYYICEIALDPPVSPWYIRMSRRNADGEWVTWKDKVKGPYAKEADARRACGLMDSFNQKDTDYEVWQEGE